MKILLRNRNIQEKLANTTHQNTQTRQVTQYIKNSLGIFILLYLDKFYQFAF